MHQRSPIKETENLRGNYRTTFRMSMSLAFQMRSGSHTHLTRMEARAGLWGQTCLSLHRGPANSRLCDLDMALNLSGSQRQPLNPDYLNLNF